jgi:hypothetical protein
MDNNYFTPFGARITPPPVIAVSSRSRVPYKLMVIVWVTSWLFAWLSVASLFYQAAHTFGRYEHRFAAEDRV